MLTLAGADLMLDAALSGVGYTATLYLGLIDGSGVAPAYGAADTMAAHPGWTELQDYQGDTRLALWFSPAADGAKASLSSAFTYTAPCRVAGFFVTTDRTKGGAGGVLIGAAGFDPFDRAPGDATTLRWSLVLPDTGS